MRLVNKITAIGIISLISSVTISDHSTQKAWQSIQADYEHSIIEYNTKLAKCNKTRRNNKPDITSSLTANFDKTYLNKYQENVIHLIFYLNAVLFENCTQPERDQLIIRENIYFSNMPEILRDLFSSHEGDEMPLLVGHLKTIYEKFDIEFADLSSSDDITTLTQLKQSIEDIPYNITVSNMVLSDEISMRSDLLKSKATPVDINDFLKDVFTEPVDRLHLIDEVHKLFPEIYDRNNQ